MSKQVRNRIGYWFFLGLGMVALVNQYFVQGWIHIWYVEFLKTLLFGIFVFKPLVLIEIWRSISVYFINKSKNGKTENEFIDYASKGGGKRIVPDRDDDV